MKIFHVNKTSEWKVLGGNSQGQAAAMTLKAQENTDGPQNKHPSSDQWMFVISGKGEAIVEKKSHPLSPGTLLLIEKGESHEIRNTGEENLNTLNVYIPPEY